MTYDNYAAGQILTADALNAPFLDSGWVNVTIAPGFAGNGGADTPKVRRIGNVVYFQGGWANTGISGSSSYTIGTIPDGFRPTTDLAIGVGSSSAAALAVGFMTSGGAVLLRTSGTVGGYYRYCASWLID